MIKELPLCECGCKNQVTKLGNRFILGHNAQGRSRLKPIPEPKLCKCGCGEYTKPGNDYIRGHHLRGNKNPMKNPDTAKKISDIVKEQWKDEDYRDAHSGKNHKQYDSVELICAFCGEKYTVQSYRKNTSRFCSFECLGKYRSAELIGEKSSRWKGGKVIIICEICGDEFEVDPYQEGITRFCSRKCLNIWMSEREIPDSQRIAISCGHQGISIEDFDGFIGDTPYCPKFNDRLKQKVRDKYNECDYFSGLHYTICNIMSNGKVRRLCIHHVDYNKLQGCDGHKWKLVPLSHSNHSKTNGNRSFWEQLICYALEYDETYYNKEPIDIWRINGSK